MMLSVVVVFKSVVVVDCSGSIDIGGIMIQICRECINGGISI